MTAIRVSAVGLPSDYKTSLVPAICQNLGYQIEWVEPKKCDLMIIGSFHNLGKKKLAWCPKPLRPLVKSLGDGIQAIIPASHKQALILFQTGENLRHDFVSNDYALTFDLGVSGPHHFRMPYWMEVADWSAQGVTGNTNPRYGKLLDINRLLQPLGNDFLMRPQKAAIFASHLREPRGTLLNAVKSQIEVVEFGKSFNPLIKNHSESGLIKFDELQAFAFNLCPENGMHPGYYTEKIPEAFMAGCLPITWADENVKADFNPNAFINLAPMAISHFTKLGEILHSKEALATYAEQPLLLARPSIEPLKKFIKQILESATS
ncbi:glycosyltransferase family 10 domain-containing protein [Polynucleobacter sp. JS-JIR-II-b4]|uniref:glycosyltransferase family 10 domain-containing protein n=1 Tax=Polynucleobacter sp. JS-JIR-II-b4 TaxID=1758390 RepID=UPI001BFD81F5|nr:glycosyltransferase family 10 [Polynucleobacter sp. JS-JIR-II-b4]QWE02770.1 hypothetical protein ICV90_01380 [Polynucleobacter sp. JS-JIR-II-b4]